MTPAQYVAAEKAMEVMFAQSVRKLRALGDADAAADWAFDVAHAMATLASQEPADHTYTGGYLPWPTLAAALAGVAKAALRKQERVVAQLLAEAYRLADLTGGWMTPEYSAALRALYAAQASLAALECATYGKK
jgi:hypothetical protein